MSLRLAPRSDVPRWLRVASPFASVVLALALGAALLAAAGLDPGAVYLAMAEAGLGGRYALSDTLVKATPILLCALGVAFGFRARVWNIGAEGQLLMGAWAATGVALHILPAGTPKPLMLGAMALAGMLAGGLWAGVAGVLRARLGVSEIVTTLMANYVAADFVAYFVFGPWSEGGFQLTRQIPESAWLPRLADYAASVPAFEGLTAHLGFVFGLVAAAVLAVVLDRTPLGYEIRVVGAAPRAARAAGMSIGRTVILVMVTSGALAGLAGMAEIAGVVHRLQDRFSPGYGFAGIIVAWLADLRPLGIVLASLLFGALLVGGKQIQPAGVPQMLEGLILFVVVGANAMLRYRVQIVREAA